MVLGNVNLTQHHNQYAYVEYCLRETLLYGIVDIVILLEKFAELIGRPLIDHTAAAAVRNQLEEPSSSLKDSVHEIPVAIISH